jgi:multidrug efflux pump subunit AcrA (membrane-fusion protein)
MPAPAWVEDDGTVTAMLYTDELAFQTPEERAVFAPFTAPASAIFVRATADAPEPWDRSTRRVHFRADATSPPLRPRDVGWLRRVTRSPEPPVIPDSAILEDADGPYVLVLSNDGRQVSKRAVEIGRVFGGVAAVLSGLGPSERALITGAFFLDAERRLRREATIEVTPR